MRRSLMGTVCVYQPLQRIENEVELLGEHLSLGAGLHYPPATHPALTPHSAQLHFLSHEPLPQEFFGVVSNNNNRKAFLPPRKIHVTDFSRMCRQSPSSPIPTSSPGVSRGDGTDHNSHCHLRLTTPASCLTSCE